MDHDKIAIKIKNELKEEHCTDASAPYNLLQCFSSKDSSLKKICCLCLLPGECLSSLFSVVDDIRIADMLKSFTSIPNSLEELMPNQLCNSCKTDVIHCYNFKVKCEKSISNLQLLLKNELLTTDADVAVEQKSAGANHCSNEVGVESGIKSEGENDVQYLEDTQDLDSDNGNLYILSHTEDAKCTQRPSRESEIIQAELLMARKQKKKYKSKNEHICSICDEKFDIFKNLQTHIKSRHSMEKKVTYPCKQCKEVFGCEHDLKVHSSVHTAGPKWVCLECSKEFKARSMLRRHLQRHMEVKRFTCESCGKAFAEFYALRRHWRVHTGETVEKKHVCHICNKRYVEGSQLAAHVSRHTCERPFVCAACGKTFPSARLLASHRLVHSDLKPHVCAYCDKRFRHESTRNTHHRTHTGEKPYVCSTCGKTFIQNSNLRLHMRTHTGEKPYSCQSCDKKFSSGSSLKMHLRTHTGEKPYGCKICGKRFARMDLSAHMRQHTGERPHACSACPKRFASATRLRDHCRIHTGEKPFECASCTEKFPTRSHLVKHIKKHQQKKKKEKRAVVVVRRVDYAQPLILAEKYVIDGNEAQQDTNKVQEITYNNEESKDMPLEIVHDVPLVTEELVVQDEGEVLIMDNSPDDVDYQNGHIYLNTGTVVSNNMNYTDNVNLVAVNDGGVSISSSASLEGTTVKLYQLDQSLLQIHSSGGQVTISKITSKMTANF